MANIGFLSGLGYTIEEFGYNTIRIKTIPVMLGRQFNRQMFIDFVDELSSKEEVNPESLERFFHARIARMSCRSAIKAGDEITMPQIKQYIQKLDENKVYTCPHGRPIMLKWDFYELEKMFKRVV
jgi:DNA mismatch repair protein MutL